MKPSNQLGVKLLRNVHAWIKAPRQRRAIEAFDRVELGVGDIAVDCGANVGDVTLKLAAGGATVHAFEPFPEAFDRLEARTRDLPEVHCHRCAVSDRNGTAELFLHHRRHEDPLYHSAGSSLLAAKHNLDPARFVEVETRSLADVIEALPGRVKLLKIDVEGFEAVLLNHLLDRGVLDRVDHVFCETHEFKVPGLYRACRDLRRRLRAEGITHVNLDWC